MAQTLTKRQISEDILFGPRVSVEAAGKSVVKLPEMLGRSDDAAKIFQEASVPYLIPLAVPERSARRASLVIRANRLLQIGLVVCCLLAVLGYGLDVAVSNDVTRMQEQARRLSEQNSELSAQLLKAISFQGIQESALGGVGLRVPEQVLIVKEVQPVKVSSIKAAKHYLPIMSGY